MPFLVFYVGQDGQLQEDQFTLDNDTQQEREKVLKQMETLDAIVALFSNANLWDQTKKEVEQQLVSSVENIYDYKQIPFFWALDKLRITEEGPVSPPSNDKGNTKKQPSEDPSVRERKKPTEEVLGYVLSVVLVKTKTVEEKEGKEKLLFRKVLPSHIAHGTFLDKVNEVKREFLSANPGSILQEDDVLHLRLKRIIENDTLAATENGGGAPTEGDI